MQTRRRFKPSTSFRDRLRAFAEEAREKAANLPSGIEREDMLCKARRADTACHLDEWANSAGLQPPK